MIICREMIDQIQVKWMIRIVDQFFLMLCEIYSILLGIRSLTLSSSYSFNSPLESMSLVYIYRSVINCRISFNTNSDIYNPYNANILNTFPNLDILVCNYLEMMFTCDGFRSPSFLL